MSDIKDFVVPPDKPADQPDPEEVAALLNGLERAKKEVAEQPSDLEIACAGGMNVVTIPARFTVSYREERFLANEFRAWAWTPFGVLAIGRWEIDPDDTEKHVLIHGDQLIEIELQIEPYEDAIKEVEAKKAAEEQGDEQTEGTSSEDDGEPESSSD